MAHRHDADALPRGDQRFRDPSTSVRLAGAWRTLHAKNALVEPHYKLGEFVRVVTELSHGRAWAIERSFAGGRIRQFNADEILALSRGFRLPIGWFFTPPPVMDNIDISTPDAKGGVWELFLLIDAILGNPDTLPEWEEALRLWSVSSNRMRIYDDGRTEDLGREVDDVHDGIDTFLKDKARVRLDELLGDVDRAKKALAGLAGLLDDLDDVPTDADDPPSGGINQQKGGPT